MLPRQNVCCSFQHALAAANAMQRLHQRSTGCIAGFSSTTQSSSSTQAGVQHSRLQIGHIIVFNAVETAAFTAHHGSRGRGSSRSLGSSSSSSSSTCTTSSSSSSSSSSWSRRPLQAHSSESDVAGDCAGSWSCACLSWQSFFGQQRQQDAAHANDTVCLHSVPCTRLLLHCCYHVVATQQRHQ
jgi:hypothetical protein